jgi:large repetitive protein
MSPATVGDATLTPLPVTFAPTEGVSFTGVVGNFTDANTNPDLADYSATIFWGDSTTTVGTIMPNASGGFEVTGTHTYAEQDSYYEVTVTINDAGGSSVIVYSSAAVADAALTPAAVTFKPKEGIAFTGVVANFTDANGNPDINDFWATIVWGDGSSSAGTIAANGAGGFKVMGTHTYAEEGAVAADVTIHDVGGSMAVAHSTAAVADAALTPAAVTFKPREGIAFTGVVATFRDGNTNPDLADFSATIVWGDGTTSAGTISANGTGGFKVSGTHTYAEEGARMRPPSRFTTRAAARRSPIARRRWPTPP